jgi:hypothetical protein
MSKINISNPGNKSISLEIKSVDGTIEVLSSNNDSLQLDGENPQHEAFNKVSVCLAQFELTCEGATNDSGCIELDDNGTYDLYDGDQLLIENASPTQLMDFINANQIDLSLELVPCSIYCEPGAFTMSAPSGFTYDIEEAEYVIFKYNDQIYNSLNESWEDNINYIVLSKQSIADIVSYSTRFASFTKLGFIAASFLFYSGFDLFRQTTDAGYSYNYSYATRNGFNELELFDTTTQMNPIWTINGRSTDDLGTINLQRRLHFLVMTGREDYVAALSTVGVAILPEDDLSSYYDLVHRLFSFDQVIESCSKYEPAGG